MLALGIYFAYMKLFDSVKREFNAEIELSYRSLFWFRKAKKYAFWVKPMNNGDVEWLQTQ